MPPRSHFYPGILPGLRRFAEKQLSAYGFSFHAPSFRGALFVNPDTGMAVLLDHRICDTRYPFAYTLYTKKQNALMHQYRGVFRFMADTRNDLEDTARTLDRLQHNDFIESRIHYAGRHRQWYDIDPTLFYRHRLDAGCQVYKPNRPYQHPEKLDDHAFMKTSLKTYYQNLGGLPDEEALRDSWQIPADTPVAPKKTESQETIHIIPFEEIREARFRTALPLVGRLAAGEPFQGFDVQDLAILGDHIDWVEVPERWCSENRYVVQVVGDSMAPTIRAVVQFNR